ncbi:hypothetical protein [Flavobacterium piscinae]|uniref:hypothetical protein n=1 Tax=Flavobacterium piscinae TaxID=2506424 RepID=UPI002AAA971B|nr:hypothetical protein [Flavobacterium piscinae]
MKKIILLLLLWCFSLPVFSQTEKVYVDANNSQMKLKVNGKDFIVNGMNWDYFPIGTNYSYSLWNQPDNIVQEALDEEMGLLKNMGLILFGYIQEFLKNGLNTFMLTMEFILC